LISGKGHSIYLLELHNLLMNTLKSTGFKTDLGTSENTPKDTLLTMEPICIITRKLHRTRPDAWLKEIYKKQFSIQSLLAT
jgi:hypothetical protein